MIRMARLCCLFLLLGQISLVFCQSVPLPQSDLQADFDTLCQKLETIHADLYLHQSPEQYRQRKKTIRLAIKDMSPEQFYLMIAPFVASIGDGHTTIDVPIQARSKYMQEGGKTFPLRLRLERGKLLVDFPLILTGEVGENDEITAINGVPSAEIARKLYTLKGADKTSFIHDNTLTRYLSTLLWYVYRWEDDYEFEIKTADATKSIRLPGLTQAEAFPVLQERLSKPIRQFLSEIHPETQRALLTVKNFFDLEGLTAFCDSIFPELRHLQIDDLTVDIRGNSGGSSDAVEKMMTYFSHDAYRIYTRHDLKISPESKVYNRHLHPEIYKQIKDLPEGSTQISYCDTIAGNRDDEKTYKGKLTVLVDESTYSAACTFATLVERSNAGTVSGNTGCDTVSFGNYISGQLPHSGLSYYIAFKKFYE